MYSGTLGPVSNKQTWRQGFQIIDDDSGDAFDIGNATAITLWVRDPRSLTAVLTASLDNGKITLQDDTGVFQVLFSASDMGALAPKSYDIGITITADGDTSQLLIGMLPVLDGIVN